MQGVVVRGHRIVMPQTSRDRTLALAHQGHQGVIKTTIVADKSLVAQD